MGHDEAQPTSLAICVVLAWSPAPQRVEQETLSLPLGATLGQALQASTRLRQQWPGPLESLRCGVWSKLRPLDHLLRDGDRVEVYRPLLVDPKEARRQRYRKTSVKRTSPPDSSL
ncbi:MAG: RnfH family protein [Betaproteobacteria bacterium]|nr:RnfH family protein [Betaproteobacteria bacterium]